MCGIFLTEKSIGLYREFSKARRKAHAQLDESFECS